MMNSQNIWLQHGWDSRQCIWILEASPHIRQQQHTKRETQGKKYLKRQTNQQSKSFYFAPNRKRHCTFLLLPAWDCSIRKSKMPFFPTSGRKISSSSFFWQTYCKWIENLPGKVSEKTLSSTFPKVTLKSYQENRKEYTRCWCGDSLKDGVIRDLISEINSYNVRFVS